MKPTFNPVANHWVDGDDYLDVSPRRDLPTRFFLVAQTKPDSCIMKRKWVVKARTEQEAIGMITKELPIKNHELHFMPLDEYMKTDFMEV